MRVKRLEIQGFKSFKDKTIVHFDHSITGIVGPNGCGKSNIVDAFFWVMGETSNKHMRASGSDDLIFNGSSKYSPVGIAEATLVLEKLEVDPKKAPAGATSKDVPLPSKKEEVSVTRRVYRGGEGEYLLNGVPCRLRDIKEMFMDTGVGAKGYSVVEQGQIGRIVNSKPDERRLLVEEAAGIAKYKARKNESLRKMASTNANLERLHDIIKEIERSLKSLERQAAKARKYKEYKQQLLEKEIVWGRRKLLFLKQKISHVRKEKRSAEEEVASLRRELQGIENNLESQRVANTSAVKLAEDLQLKIQELSKNLAQEESQLELGRRRQEDLTTQQDSLANEKEELIVSSREEEEKLSELETERAGSEQALTKVAGEAGRMDEKVRGLRAEAVGVRDSLETTKKELLTILNQMSEFSSRESALEARKQANEEQSVKLIERKNLLEKKFDSVKSAAAEFEKQFCELENAKQTLSGRVTQEEERVALAKEALEQREIEKNLKHAETAEKRSKLKSLEELADAYEGLANGPKGVLDWAKERGIQNKFRVVADLFDVDGGFEAAIQGWLGNTLEDLVSSDIRSSLRGLERLNQQEAGRATIHVGLLNQATASSHLYDYVKSLLSAYDIEVLGQLTDYAKPAVGLEDALSVRMRQLLDQVVVVRSLAGIENVLSHKEFSAFLGELDGWSLVSIEGDVLEWSGALRGGRGDTNATEHLLARRREIDELKVEVKNQEEEFARIEAQFATSKTDFEAYQAALDGVRREQQELEIRLAKSEHEYQQALRQRDDVGSQLEVIQTESAQIGDSTEAATAELARIRQETEALIQKQAQNEAQASMDDLELSGRDEALQVEETQLQEMRLREASMRERSQGLGREIDAIRSLLTSRQDRLKELDRLAERVRVERDQHQGSQPELEQKIETLNRSLRQHQDQQMSVRDQVEQSTAQINESLEKIKELHKKGEARSERVNEVAIEVEKLIADESHLVQNLEEKYGPGCLEQARPEIQEEMEEPVVTAEMTAEEEAVLREEVEQLRERIRRLGDVNTVAIDEFEELKERYDRLGHEREDLQKSLENLQEAIDHINETSKDRFEKAFTAIAKRFSQLFPIIFGGGRAELSLIFPEGSTDVLEAGVDILGQPPGKKIQNISLLSGGEKALTAISLIFAIFMVKPSPFCVLDEVDAPLDDANIGKFNALLREMSVRTQFIIITHNKKTMELNETLYGVTMEEPGVSKMISIEMN